MSKKHVARCVGCGTLIGIDCAKDCPVRKDTEAFLESMHRNVKEIGEQYRIRAQKVDDANAKVGSTLAEHVSEELLLHECSEHRGLLVTAWWHVTVAHAAERIEERPDGMFFGRAIQPETQIEAFFAREAQRRERNRRARSLMSVNVQAQKAANNLALWEARRDAGSLVKGTKVRLHCWGRDEFVLMDCRVDANTVSYLVTDCSTITRASFPRWFEAVEIRRRPRT